MTEPTPTPAQEPAPAQAPEPQASVPTWDELFKDEDPAKVRQALEQSRKWEQRAKENKAAADELAKLKESQLSEQERLATKLTEAEKTLAQARLDRVVDKIEAKAARGFADPEDAVAILLRSHSADDFLDGDTVNVGAIQEALNGLLSRKPHLAASQEPLPRFQGSSDGGARQEKPKTLQEQIADAEKAGDKNLVFRLKARQAMTANR